MVGGYVEAHHQHERMPVSATGIEYIFHVVAGGEVGFHLLNGTVLADIKDGIIPRVSASMISRRTEAS